MKRTLTLKREALIELTAADLGAIAGAQADPSIGSCPVLNCVHVPHSQELYYTCTCGTATGSC